MNYWPFLGYALAPFLVWGILLAFRPLTKWLYKKAGDGLVRRVLFFRWG